MIVNALKSVAEKKISSKLRKKAKRTGIAKTISGGLKDLSKYLSEGHGLGGNILDVPVELARGLLSAATGGILVDTATTRAVEENPGPPKGKGKKKPKKKAQTKPGKTRSEGKAVATGGVSSRIKHVPAYVKSSTRSTLTLAGVSYLGMSEQKDTQVAGTRLAMIPIHPDGMLASSRLAIFSKGFETFLFLVARVHRTSSAPATEHGSISDYFDLDAGDKELPETADPAFLKAEAFEHGGGMTKSWEGSSLTMPKQHQQKEYFVDDGNSDPRLTLQGRYYSAVATPLASGAGSVFHDYWLEWEVVFKIPQLDVKMDTLSSGGWAFQCYNTAGTATVPVFNATNFTGSTSAYSGMKPGFGIAYNGSGSFLYCKSGTTFPAAFTVATEANQAVLVGLATLHHANLSLVTDLISSGTNQINGVAFSVFVWNGATSTTSFTAASTWNGHGWEIESSPTSLSINWYLGWTASTLTTPTAFKCYINPLSLVQLSAYSRFRSRFSGTKPLSEPEPSRRAEAKESKEDYHLVKKSSTKGSV